MTRLGLRAVFFDWDGTLVDSAAATYRCYERIFRSFGVSFDRERFQTWARAAGVFSVGVPGGFPNREALREARPDLWVESLIEAAEALLAAAKG